MIHLAVLSRAAVRPLTASVLPSLVRTVPLPRLAASFATAASSTATTATQAKSKTAKPKAAKTATRAAKAPTTKKAATKAAKPKPKPKAKPKKAEAKLKPWQARGPDGKLLPLPSTTKPTLRSTFIIFMTEKVQHLKGKPEFTKPSVNGDKQVLDLIKVSKRIGEDWNSLPVSEKRKYEEMHEKERGEYVKALAQWKASLSPEDIRRQNAYTTAQRKKGIKGVALLRDPARPKRPNSAFFEYLADLRRKEPSLSSTEVSRKGGEEWKTLSADQKAPYEQRAIGAFEQYRKDVEEYNRAKEATV